MKIIQSVLNRILFRKTRANRYFKQFESCLVTHADSWENTSAADIFLTVLLKLMALVFFLNPEFRLNIKDFEAKYVFIDKNKKLYVVAEFKKSKMKVRQKQIDDYNLQLLFKDGSSLFKLLLSESPDVLDAMLNQEVDFNGNINYLYKFAYMAMRLKLMATGKV